MQAIQLLALLQEQFNVALHLDALTYLGPTPARLAILVSEANERSAFSPVMPLQPGAESSRIPLFCMPMLGAASLFPYRRLAQHLHGVVPMMGLLPPGRDGRTPAPRSMQELALYGIDALRHHQPHGPYRLCGLLSAGLMAYEMACLLTLQGETVAGVVLVDTRLPSSAMQFLARLGVAGPRIMDGVALTHSVLPAPIQQLYRRLRVAGRSYRPSVFEDPILLVTASQSVQRLGDPTLGWKRYCPQLETIELSSRHDDLPHEPAAEQLGQILTTHLFSA
jgi:thioesterase domain-containing protein